MSETPTAAKPTAAPLNDSRVSMRQPSNGTAAGRSVDGTD
jgi:hypothetical protein